MIRVTSSLGRRLRVVFAAAFFVGVIGIAALAQSGVAHANAASPEVKHSSTKKTTSNLLNELVNSTYTLTITQDGKTLTGTFNTGTKAVEYPALLGSFTALGTDEQAFFGWSDAVQAYFEKFATNGYFTSGVFTFTGSDTPSGAPNSVRIVIGAPAPGSLSGGSGIITLDGTLQADGTITGSSNGTSWIATPQ